jgi:hypothetical protein
MNQNEETLSSHQVSEEHSSSFKTLMVAVLTGLVFWASLLALLFFALTN